MSEVIYLQACLPNFKQQMNEIMKRKREIENVVVDKDIMSTSDASNDVIDISAAEDLVFTRGDNDTVEYDNDDGNNDVDMIRDDVDILSIEIHIEHGDIKWFNDYKHTIFSEILLTIENQLGYMYSNTLLNGFENQKEFKKNIQKEYMSASLSSSSHNAHSSATIEWEDIEAIRLSTYSASSSANLGLFRLSKKLWYRSCDNIQILYYLKIFDDYLPCEDTTSADMIKDLYVLPLLKDNKVLDAYNAKKFHMLKDRVFVIQVYPIGTKYAGTDKAGLASSEDKLKGLESKKRKIKHKHQKHLRKEKQKG